MRCVSSWRSTVVGVFVWRRGPMVAAQLPGWFNDSSCRAQRAQRRGLTWSQATGSAGENSSGCVVPALLLFTVPIPVIANPAAGGARQSCTPYAEEPGTVFPRLDYRPNEIATVPFGESAMTERSKTGSEARPHIGTCPRLSHGPFWGSVAHTAGRAGGPGFDLEALRNSRDRTCSMSPSLLPATPSE